MEIFEIVLYTNKTLIFRSVEDNKEYQANISNDISKINSLLNMHKLKLDENKTKILQINYNGYGIELEMSMIFEY